MFQVWHYNLFYCTALKLFGFEIISGSLKKRVGNKLPTLRRLPKKAHFHLQHFF
ncbi:MAG: hypothetical protein IKZ88_04730 [Neisseriaceae bacterium]|nr:hypothetical protein [Neisseriaceae bacterium]MBR5940543.1 hypothetical protein [Neisseriaceae bacterium]